jgi:hypothetical protein
LQWARKYPSRGKEVRKEGRKGRGEEGRREGRTDERMNCMNTGKHLSLEAGASRKTVGIETTARGQLSHEGALEKPLVHYCL